MNIFAKPFKDLGVIEKEKGKEKITMFEVHTEYLLNKRIESLETKTDEMNKKVESLETKTDIMNKKIEKLESKTDVMNQKIDVMSKKVESLESKTNEMNQKIEKLESKMDAVDNKVEKLESKLDEKFETLNKSIKEKIEEVLSAVNYSHPSAFQYFKKSENQEEKKHYI